MGTEKYLGMSVGDREEEWFSFPKGLGNGDTTGKATTLPEKSVLYSPVLHLSSLLGMQASSLWDRWCLVFGSHMNIYLYFAKAFSISWRHAYCALKSNFPLHGLQPLEDF